MSEQTDQSPADRLQAAEKALGEAVESGKVLGIGGVQIPPHAETLAAVNAIALLLIEKDVIGEAEFVERKTEQMAEQVESVVEQLKEIKRQLSSKLLLAHQNPPVI